VSGFRSSNPLKTVVWDEPMARAEERFPRMEPSSSSSRPISLDARCSGCDAFISRPHAGTDEALMPFWSPDSRFIGFFVAGKLRRMDAADGSIQTTCDAPGTWARGDMGQP
jgi:hypothetical protein